MKRKSTSRRWIALGLSTLVILLGVGAWWLLQSHRRSREQAFQLHVTPPASGEGLKLALFQSLGVDLTAGHRLTYLPNGSVFDALVTRIEAAQGSVNIAMYIWESGRASNRVVRALVGRARAGVRCRVLVDDVGSPDFMDTVAPELRQAGCEVRVFRPLHGNEKLARSHRKLVIVDGQTGITGGFGIRDNWLGDGVHGESWRDSNVLFSGPAVPYAQQAFAENWQEAGGGLLPAGDFPAPTASELAKVAFVGSTQGVVTRAERVTQLLMAGAKRRLWISNAYFVPSAGILELIKRKARAGVDVRLLAPYKNSDSKTAFGAQHTEYGSLVEAGVKVWEYTSSMMHAKTMLVDDELSLIGSINLDPLSLHELEEDALVVEDRTFSDQLGQAFVADCARSKRYEK